MIITLQKPYKTARGKDSAGAKGNVLYPTGGRQFSRSFVQPYNPKTTAQNIIRAFFAAANSAFSSMENAQRAGWDLINNSNLKTDKDGNKYKLSSKGWFIAVQVIRQIAGQAITTIAPAANLPVTFGSFTEATADNGAFTVSFVAKNIGDKFLIKMSDGMFYEQQHARSWKMPTDVTASNIVTADAGHVCSLSVASDHSTLSGITVNNWISIEITPLSSEYLPGTPIIINTRLVS